MGTTGHLFHVLFTLTCLQNAKSSSTLRVIIVFNTLKMILNCRVLIRGTSGAHSLNKFIQLLGNRAAVKDLDQADRTLVFSTYYRYQDARFVVLHDWTYHRVEL